MAVHLAVAGDVFDGVLFFSPRDGLDKTWDRTESVPENFPTYFFMPKQLERVA